MTQVAMIFEEEKQQALTQAAMQFAQEKQQTVIKMIEKGYSTAEIAFLVSGYSENEIDSLRKKMQNPENNV